MGYTKQNSSRQLISEMFWAIAKYVAVFGFAFSGLSLQIWLACFILIPSYETTLHVCIALMLLGVAYVLMLTATDGW